MNPGWRDPGFEMKSLFAAGGTDLRPALSLAQVGPHVTNRPGGSCCRRAGLGRLRDIAYEGNQVMDWKLEVVVVPVSDVDRAKRFYSEQVGFAVDVDHQPSEKFRVVQMTPPGSACSVTIGTGLVDSEPGSLKGLQLVVSDIDAARAELLARGVEVSEIRHFDGNEWVEGRGGDWNSFIDFNDPDGNAWTVQEAPAGR
jgi:catechol 2,3-dioxygenase-like lactoylglutathione lyase family enzyme